MNLYEMRLQFDRVQRTLGETTFDDYRDDWINLAWQKITDAFIIPSMKREVYIDSVADQQRYVFPYDYNGAEVSLQFKRSSTAQYRRLDPVPEEDMDLQYELRSGNKGQVLYYDWCQNIGSDYASRASCTPTNGSTTVTCATAAAADVDQWIRFDPVTSGTTTTDPGDYGYLISSVSAGVSYTLDRAYRGPAGTFTGRVRPAESSQFITYGIPDSAVTDAFYLKYYAKPRRLYNNADVPEWSNMGMPIVYMAISLAYDWTNNHEHAATWFGRSMNAVSNLQKRKEMSRRLVTDLTIGSMVGRKTGPYGVFNRSIWRR